MNVHIRNIPLIRGILAAALVFTVAGAQALTVGDQAPTFSSIDSNGITHDLGDYRGRTVVLEWTNHDCPYVKKHYESGTMQSLQKDATANEVVWLSLISSRPGSQGHLSGEQANQLTATRGAHPSAVLLDESGTVGRLYNAKTTPHMYVVDASGTLVYQGGIDDKRSSRLSSLEGATPYVRNALAQLASGEEIADQSTRPYGCSVKY